MKRITGILALFAALNCGQAFAVSIQMPMIDIALAGERVKEFELTNKDTQPVKLGVKIIPVDGEEKPNVAVWPPIVEVQPGADAKFRVQIKHGTEAPEKEVPFRVLWYVVLSPEQEYLPNTLTVAPRGFINGYVSKAALETNVVATRVKDGIKLTNTGGHYAHVTHVRINGTTKQNIEYVYAGRSIVVPIKDKGTVEFLDIGGGVIAKVS